MAKQIKSKGAEPEQEKKERTSLYLLPSMQQKIKFICLKDNVFQNDVAEIALAEYIERWEKKNGEISI